MSGKILYAVADGVATITLSRPQVMNALDAQMIVQLREACEQARDDARARAVLLRGEGPAFLAGGDVAFFRENLPRMPELAAQGAGELHRAVLALRRTLKPVVASVHGAVAGAGMSLMAAADFVIAAADTQFTMAYSRIGASPDGGSTFFLPRLIGYQRAMELMLLSDMVDAATLHGFGLINRVVPARALESETRTVVARFAAGPTLAFGETKALANRACDGLLEAQLAAEAQAFARCAATRDFAEGVTAFVEKRSPQFRGA